MNAMRTGVGMVLVGLLGWAHVSQAEMAQNPREPMAWVIETADYTGDVRDQIARLDATYTIRLIRDGWVEVPLAIQGVTVTDITIGKKTGEAHLIPRGSCMRWLRARRGRTSFT